MSSRSAMVFFSLIVLLLAVAACQPQVPPAATATEPLSELTITALIQTITAQAATLSTSTPTPLPSVTETTPIPATDTLTPTPGIPMVRISSETNCRTGPSKYYKLVWEAEAGSTFKVIGKHEATNYWIIQLPDNRQCWLWGQHATVEGDVDSLPEHSQPAVGKIEGELRISSDTNAEKISQADVSIGLPDFPLTRTGNNGKFVFEDVPFGEIKIDVKHDHHIFPNSIRVIVRIGQLSTVTIFPIVPTDLTLPAPTAPGSCPIFQPNCQFLPSPGPALP